MGELDFGQFLFLYMLGRNVDLSVYKKILEGMSVNKMHNLFRSISSAPPAPNVYPSLVEPDCGNVQDVNEEEIEMGDLKQK